jgi:hypothetical protein
MKSASAYLYTVIYRQLILLTARCYRKVISTSPKSVQVRRASARFNAEALCGQDAPLRWELGGMPGHTNQHYIFAAPFLGRLFVQLPRTRVPFFKAQGLGLAGPEKVEHRYLIGCLSIRVRYAAEDRLALAAHSCACLVFAHLCLWIAFRKRKYLRANFPSRPGSGVLQARQVTSPSLVSGPASALMIW